MNKETEGKKQWRHILDLWSEFGDLGDIMDVIAKKGKYPRGSWRHVPVEDFEDALMRHLDSHLKGDLVDKETGKLHISHVAWNCFVIAWHEKNKDIKGIARNLNVSSFDYPEFCDPDGAA